MDRVEALSKVYLFRELPAEQLEKLADVATSHSLSPHTVLFDEGQSGADLYVIVLGTLKVLKKRGKEGDAEEVATLATGSYFGEVAFLVDDHERSASVETTDRTELLSFKYEDLSRICDEDPKLGYYVYRALARALAKRLSNTTRDAAYFKALALHHE